MERTTITLDFYCITARVEGPSALVALLRRDFSWFAVPDGAAPLLSLSAFLSEPPFERVPPRIASLYQPDSVSYDDGEVRYVDYHGRALTVWNYATGSGEVYSADEDLLHEIVYLLLHSRVGELLDKKGLHRVHALGVACGGRGVLCLLPQGGGKSTLCLELLRNEGILLVSDDTPLIDRAGRLLPFPVRIGLGSQPGPEVPERFVGTMHRRRYGTKWLIDAAFFEGRIAGPLPLGTLIIGAREFSAAPRLERLGRTAAFIALVRDCVVGLGLPQVVEYFLRHHPREYAAKLVIALSRTAACLRAVLRCRVYRLVLGRDSAANARVLLSALKNVQARTGGKSS